MPDIFVARTASKNKSQSGNSGNMSLVNRRQKARDIMAGINPYFANKTKDPLAAFALFPDRVGFETQQQDEPVILLLRRHPFTNISWIILAVIMMMAPFLFAFLSLDITIPVQFNTFFLILWYLLVLTFVFEKFLSWFFNVFIFTDERVIDVDFYSLTYKQIGEAGLGKIEEVNYKIGGVLRSMFDFGDIFIQTAGEQPTIRFEDIPHPAQVVKILNELITLEEQEMLEGKAR